MKILITGGAGHVGSILRPALEAEHQCRYLDLRPITGAEAQTVLGSITDIGAVREAVAGCDAVVQLVMANVGEKGEDYFNRCHEAHVKGMHVLMRGVVEAGITRVVHASTLSVYAWEDRFHTSEEMPPDATNGYGLTKILAEEIGRIFARAHPDLSFLALRLVLPCDERQWANGWDSGWQRQKRFKTGPEDLRRLFLAALALQGHHGFDAVHAASDSEGQLLDMTKARELLGWQPRDE